MKMYPLSVIKKLKWEISDKSKNTYASICRNSFKFQLNSQCIFLFCYNNDPYNINMVIIQFKCTCYIVVGHKALFIIIKRCFSE